MIFKSEKPTKQNPFGEEKIIPCLINHLPFWLQGKLTFKHSRIQIALAVRYVIIFFSSVVKTEWPILRLTSVAQSFDQIKANFASFSQIKTALLTLTVKIKQNREKVTPNAVVLITFTDKNPSIGYQISLGYALTSKLYTENRTLKARYWKLWENKLYKHCNKPLNCAKY